MNPALTSSISDAIKSIVSEFEKQQITSFIFTREKAIEMLTTAKNNYEIVQQRLREKIERAWDNFDFSEFPKEIEHSDYYESSTRKLLSNKEDYIKNYLYDGKYQEEQIAIILRILKYSHLNCEHITISIVDMNAIKFWLAYRDNEFERDGEWFYGEDHYKYWKDRRNKFFGKNES